MGRPVNGQGFAFIPRGVISQPKAFGVVAGLLQPSGDHGYSDERYRAAMVQHLMAVTARQELMGGRGISPTEYVPAFPERGLSEDRVRRVFRGETMAQLTDLAFWGGHFPAVADAISRYTATWSGAAPATEVESVGVIDDSGEESPLAIAAGPEALAGMPAAQAANGGDVAIRDSLAVERAAELRRLQADRVRAERQRKEAARKRDGRSPQHGFG